jgi:hypothetical protein
MLIKAIIINRNLLTTLKKTIEFLRKEDRINEIHILDNDSTYPPLLEYYDWTLEHVHFLRRNYGPHHAWASTFNHIRDADYFIVADPDCTYDNVPDDWLDKMLDAKVDKVGFSLEIDDLPDTDLAKEAYNHEKKYWKDKHPHGWDSDIDTTFALYAKGMRFTYDAVRLDRPYTIKHEPWYLTQDNIDDEWRYYLDNVSPVSTWGVKINKDENRSIKRRNTR